MQLDDLKEAYKNLPTWKRLALCFVVGVLPAVYIYFTDSESIQLDMDAAVGQQTTVRTQFETSRTQKANIGSLEERLQFTQEQLVKAKKSLPDSYRIEDVLERIATIAKETGVQLKTFTPGQEQQSHGSAQYVERLIGTAIVGRFSQAAAFFDRVVHLESSIFLKRISIKRNDGERNPVAVANEASEHQKALAARRDVKVLATFDLAVYRSLAPGEVVGGAVPAVDPKTGLPSPGGAAAGAAPVSKVN